jgi:bacteriocin-like protein
MKEARMTNDSKSTLQGNKTDQDQLTDDQLQAVSGGIDQNLANHLQQQQDNAEQLKEHQTFAQLVMGG